jgi:anti-sigma regulatory factor (Ser/Thr protein kinase)
VIFSGTHVVDRGTIERTADAHVTKDEGVDLLFDVIDDVASSPPKSASLALDPRRDAIARARTFAADHCRAWNCVEQLDDVVLIVSELATNAVVHARSGHVITMRRRSGAIRIEVRDASARAPDLRELSVTEESGRGMLLVSALAVAWGVEPNDDGKLVWADVLCEGRAPVSA